MDGQSIAFINEVRFEKMANKIYIYRIVHLLVEFKHC